MDSDEVNFEMNDDRHRAVWDQFCNGDPGQIDFKNYQSVLETLLEDTDADLYPQYRKIKELMHDAYENEDLRLHFIDKKDHSHENRILNYLDRFLFEAGPVDEAGKSFPVVKLTPERIFVLLCAVQLHDYGKTRWQLTIYSLIKDVADCMKDNDNKLFVKYNENGQILLTIKARAKDLHDETEQSDLKNLAKQLSDLHSLMDAVDINDLDIDAFGRIEDYHSHNIRHFLDAIIEAKDPKKLKKGFKGKDFVLRHIIPGGTDEDKAEAKLVDHLGSLDNKHLERIKSIASAHKPFKRREGKDGVEDWYYNQAEDEDRWLCALLRLCDSLDMDRRRVIEKKKRDLTYLLDEYYKQKTPNGEVVDDNRLRVFAIWTRFLLVKEIGILHSNEDKKKHRIDILLTYYQFPNADKYFFPLRHMVEKDFMNKKFLLDILDDGQGKTGGLRINLMYRILMEENPDYPAINIDDRMGKIFEKAANKHPTPDIRENGEPDNPVRKHFTPISEDDLRFVAFERDAIELIGEPDEDKKYLYLPNSLNLYSFLNHFKDGDRISPEPLSRHLFSNSKVNPLSHNYLRDNIIRQAGNLQEYVFDGRVLEIMGPLFRVAYRHPILLKSKIDEIEKFQHIMPFSRMDGPKRISSGIPGLQEVISDSEAGGGIVHSRNILIKGGPGTGKTTIALQIFQENLKDNYPRFAGRQVLYITFEENPTRIETECRKCFGWSIEKHRILQLRMKEGNFQMSASQDLHSEENARLAAKIFMNIVDDYHAEVLFVDSLNQLCSFLRSKEIDGKKAIKYIFDEMEMQHITAFYLLEDEEENSFEEYAADGIIYLENKRGKRTLEIRKLRMQKFVPGKHSFRIMDTAALKGKQEIESKWLQPGVNLFPNVETYAERTYAEIPHDSSQRIVKTGIEGLDGLLPISPERPKEGGYLRGSVVLVIGSPGSGKTIFGLQFAKQGIMEKKEEGKCLWISFEGGRAELQFAVGRFHPGLRFNEIFSDEEKFLFRYFPPAHCDPDELIYLIHRIVKPVDHKVSRIVIDSVSELEELFDDKNSFKNYMATLIHELKQLNVTTIFLYRSPEFFGFQRRTSTVISSLVDTIISIKTFDIKNRIKKGLFVLKSRGREQKSNLQTMEILYDKGIVVSDRGWELEGLLGGETGEIKEPYIFLKLFYENAAETKINDYLIKDFRERYPMRSNRLFATVRKPHIYHEFWSFKGNYGAGHANIRIVSLNKYMVEAFRENDRLHILDGYFSSSLKEEIESDIRYNKYYNKDRRFDFLPSYSDFGVLVFQKHLAEKAQPETKVKVEDSSWGEIIKTLTPLCERLNTQPDGKNVFYTFAMPPLDNMTEFVAFFMEVLWSHGGDLYWFPPFSERLHEPSSNRLSFYKRMILRNKPLRKEVESLIKNLDPKVPANKITIDAVEKTLSDFAKDRYDIPNMIRINDQEAKGAMEFMCDLVINGHCPSPAQGDFRPYALISRKWYSEVTEFQRHVSSIKCGQEERYKLFRDGVKKESPKDTKGADNNPPALELHKLPYCRETLKSVTNQGIWCLGIIKEALSPEIGWIFIDTMVSPEIRRMRAVEKLGFPIKIEDIRSDTYSWADKDVYDKVASIMETDTVLDQKTDNLAVLFYLDYDRKDLSERDPFDEAVEYLGKANCDEHQIGDIIRQLLEAFHKITENKVLADLKKRLETGGREQRTIDVTEEDFLLQDPDAARIEGKVDGYLIKQFVRLYRESETDDSRGTRANLETIIREKSEVDINNFIEQEKKKLSDKIIRLFKFFYSATDGHLGPISSAEQVESFIRENKCTFNYGKVEKQPIYCSKLAANRPYFYRFEPIIHKHVKRLFPDTGSPKKELINEVLDSMRQEMILEVFSNPGL